MLTAGIDLSVAATATAAGYLMADQGHDGHGPGDRRGLRVGLGVGLVNGIGVGIFRVNPLIMTLGTAIIVGGLTVFIQKFATGAPRGAATSCRSSAAGASSTTCPRACWVWVPLSALIILGLRSPASAACSTPSATTPWPAGSPACACGRCRSRSTRSAGCSAALAGVVLAGYTGNVDSNLARTTCCPRWPPW